MATASEAPAPALAAAIEAAASGLGDPARAAFPPFAAVLLSGVDARVLRTRGPDALAALAREAFETLRAPRAPGARRIRVESPADRPGRGVLEVVQDDRPFLVDTVRLALRRRGLAEQLLLHPILAVERGKDGALRAVGGPGGARESLIHVEFFPRLAGAEARASLERELDESLAIVAAVTDDHGRMAEAVRELQAHVQASAPYVADGAERAAKIVRFLDWLIDRHFVFMGVRAYDVTQEEGGPTVALRPGSGLGMWRSPETSRFATPQRGADVPGELLRILADPRIVQIGKARAESRIHRAARLDRVLVKRYGADGRVAGFAIVGGLFTFRALRTPASEIPLLAERLDAILAREGAAPGSHRHKALVAAFDAAPVEFLLATDVDANAALIREVVDAEGSEDARLVLRADPDARSFYAAAILPRDRYSETVRERLRALLEERAGAVHVDERASFREDGGANLHYFCTTGPDPAALDEDVLEAEVERLTAPWEERLLDALLARFGEAEGVALAARYGPSIPEALRVTTHPEDAVRDVAGLEALYAHGEPQFALYFERGDAARETSTLRVYLARPWLLSDLLPVVDHFGIRVVDARQTPVAPADRPESVIATLRVLALGADQADLDAVAPRLTEAIGAALRGVVPDDALNGLVLHAGLDWRQADLVRAYVEYFTQIQGALARAFVCSVLLENPLAVRILVQYHEARLRPGLDAAARAEAEARLRRSFQSYRDRIAALNEDRALGGLYELVDATVRTSFWRPRDGDWRVSFKLDPRRIAELRPPKPWREIFVHAAEMDGVHLRGGPVARGGIRWSDRLDDFRTEVYGLMRTQTLKNGLIVPVGAKGGFVLRRGGLTPREARVAADRQYRVFVSGLLDLTDDLDADGSAVAPAGVHRRDGEDPYLVVAADKGTAHLSDAANEIAVARGFWLGDAFASGGSEGYDHKKVGITARGAFECVKLHFAELGLDPERAVFTVAGIGDMSGDVFGNGLLLMRRAKLVAAFDHRHVFVDPDPDPEASWEERRRLFELPGSSWADYDPKRLSPGGGVWPRSAKRIELDPRARARLGVERTVVTGQEMVRAILAMPVDLLWNGGIGTYVKASSESHADAGDRANDAVRIDAPSLRARVVGEGGNLGLTQAARVEAALGGVRLDTDAIHNSGGVDLSDHEVNYKILLAPLLRTGRLSPEARREALLAATDDACESVLAHNRAQGLCLSLDERRSRADPQAFLFAMEHLVEAQSADARELGLPDAAALQSRRALGRGLTRPELAVLLGLAKLYVRGALAGDPLLDRPALAPLYELYFPPAFRARWPEALSSHRLRREITALALANRLVDAGGVTAIPSLVAGRGLTVGAAAAALLGAEEILDAPRRRARLLAAPAPREALYTGLLALEGAVHDVARYLLAGDLDVLAEGRAGRLRAALDELRAHLGEFLSAGEASQREERRRLLAAAGLPDDLAAEVATFPLADRGVNAVRVLEAVPRGPVEVGRVYARIGEGTGLNGVYQRLAAAEPGDAWDRIVLADLRIQLLALQRELTEAVLAPGPRDAKEAADAFLAAHAETIARVETLQQPALTRASASALAVVTQALMRLREPSSRRR